MPDCFGIDKNSKSMIESISASDFDKLLKQVQDSILSSVEDSILQKQNPIGKLYFSTDNTNPAEILGFGTWELWGSGRVPVCVNESDTNFDIVEKTGGESSITLSTSQIPSHTHTFSGSQVNSDYNNVGHYHIIPSLSGSATGGAITNGITGGSHWHEVREANNYSIGITPTNIFTAGGGSFARNGDTSYASRLIAIPSTHTHNLPSHTHSVTTNASNTGWQTANHVHAVTAAGTNTNTGGGESHSNLQPYITCYIFKRTA